MVPDGTAPWARAGVSGRLRQHRGTTGPVRSVASQVRRTRRVCIPTGEGSSVGRMAPRPVMRTEKKRCKHALLAGGVEGQGMPADRGPPSMAFVGQHSRLRCRRVAQPAYGPYDSQLRPWLDPSADGRRNHQQQGRQRGPTADRARNESAKRHEIRRRMKVSAWWLPRRTEH